MTAEEGEKNFPRDEEPFLDDEKIGRLCTLCRRVAGVYTAFADIVG